MNNIKTILITLTLFSASLIQAQTRLDDISLNLPAEYNWTKGMTGYERDSLNRLQTWEVEKYNGVNILTVSISSVIKMGMREGVSDAKKMVAQTDETTLLGEGKIAGKYPYVLFKALGAEETVNQLGAFLMMYMETETTLHILRVQSEKPKLSDAFVARWSAILKNPEISPGPTVEIKKTLFILSSPQTEALADSSITKQLRKHFKVRLKQVYGKKLRPKDIRFDKKRIYITLFGDIDKTRVAKFLEINLSVRFLSLYQGTGYRQYARKADSLFNAYKTQNPEKIPTGFYGNHLPKVVLKIPMETKKELLPELKKLLERQDLSKSLKLYIGPKENRSILVYLADTTFEVLNETNIKDVQVVFGSEGYPSLQIQFDAEGRKNLASWTKNHLSEPLAIMIDGKVYVAPKIRMPITQGIVQISGDFMLEELMNLRNLILFSYPIPIVVEAVNEL